MDNTGGIIYAMQLGGSPPIKIGKTTTTVEQRRQQLQTGFPARLEVVAWVAVHEHLTLVEKQIHTFLTEARIQGEWFDIAMDMATLEALALRALEHLASLEEVLTTRQQCMQVVGSRVRLVRRAKDLTQEALASQASLNVITISRLENGTAKAVYADTVAALARALGVSGDYLLGLSDREDGHT